MRVADRTPSRILAAPFNPKHWRALYGIVTTFPQPVETLRRYLLNRGRYPWETHLRTPLGRIRVRLNDRHDLLTVCEIFCRRDYGSEAPRLVVDIGANVGFAALFFLTRRNDSFVVCCEPDPDNVAVLQRNLAEYAGRYELVRAAIVVEDVPAVRFSPAGRYGRVDAEGGSEVPALTIGRLLSSVTAARGRADLVKIDTEGTEEALVAALPESALPRSVRWEDGKGHVRRRTFPD
jgi:FkbM family methyltransferase